jgi:DNA adenine methylase
MKTTIKTLKPLLRWAGSKFNQSQVCDRVRSLYNPYRNTHVWVEPFCGGLGMTHRVMPDRAILNDVNPVLIRFYQHLQCGEAIVKVPGEYTQVRDAFNACLPVSIENGDRSLAAIAITSLFYHLNRAGFNGLWRVNQSGKYNVPVGRDSKGEPLRVELPTEDYLREWRSSALSWRFICDDWQEQLCLKRNGNPVNQDPRFVYCDPPYDSTFAGYAKSGFDWGEQRQLAEWLAIQPHPVVASNAATDRILELYRGLGFQVELINCHRSISCNGDRAKALEMLAYKGIEKESID